MTRAQIHRGILRRLLSLRGRVVGSVRLVSRLYNDELLGGDSVTRTFLFFPDLHLLSQPGERDYRYGFRRLKGSRYVKRHVLLDRVCGTMLDFWNRLPRGRSLKVVQLGDMLDLWRENERRQDDMTALVARILDDNLEARRRLVRRGRQSLEPDVVLGNHDLRMDRSIELRHARRACTYKIGNRRSLLATHGDLFDPVEIATPDKLVEWAIEKFGRSASPGTNALDRTTERHTDGMVGPQGSPPIELEDEAASDVLPDWVNVWVTVAPCPEDDLRDSHELLPIALQYATGVRSGTKGTLRRMRLASSLPDLRTMVIGHSHDARICIHRDRDKPKNGLVLVDCGAWLEFSRFGPSTVPSCQIGVLCGGDMRIYQLDPHDSLYA
ncbi:MAG: hypothetical protein ACE5IQ_13700 [Candidatus Methylomirabilales bacterium]